MAHSTLHPIIDPAEQYEHPQYPVRDETKLGPTEDLDREPDGAPHALFAVLALVLVVFAALLFVLSTERKLDDVVVIAIAVPALIFSLSRFARRRRDRRHPSR